MTRTTPPALATRLLERLTGPESEAIIGDLIEQWGSRSDFWYWRQALLAIASSTCRGLRENRAIAAGGLVIGWVALILVVCVFEIVRTQLMVGGLIGVKMWWWQHSSFSLEWPARVVCFSVGAIVSGWMVSRSCQERWAGTVLIFLSSYLLIAVWSVSWIAVRVAQDPHPYALSEQLNLLGHVLMVFVICPAGILTGGLFPTRR